MRNFVFLFENAKEQIKRIRVSFRKKSPLKTDKAKTITIRQRNDPPSNSVTTSEAKKITIRGINQAPPPESTINIFAHSVEMQNNSSIGMTVKNRRRPSRCPICRTEGGVIENLDGSPQWKCTAPDCGRTFN